jgi:hypothetical protein
VDDWQVIFIPLGLAAALFALGIYFKYRPPDMSAAGARNLQQALWLGSASPIALMLLVAAGYFHRHIGPGLPVLSLVCAYLGNIFNLVAVFLCLSELSGESLFAGLLLLLTQALWVLYALLAVFSNFS